MIRHLMVEVEFDTDLNATGEPNLASDISLSQ